MSFVNRMWRFFRLGLLIVAFIAVSFYLLITTRWGKLFGQEPTYAAMIQEGTPVVAAIYHFKAERGLWPEFLDDLAPAYLPKGEVAKVTKADWYYDVRESGPVLSKPVADLRRTHVGFDFDREKPTWRVFGDEDNRVLKVLTPAAAAGGGWPTTLPREQVVDNELAELDRRIGRTQRMMHYEQGLITLGPSPAMMEYWRGKVSVLLSLGREGEARAEVAKAREADEGHFWPRLAEVAVDLEEKPEASSQKPVEAATTRGAVPPSLVAFEGWVREHPSFTHWYYLSVAQRLAGRQAEAVAAVEEAAKLPAELSPEDTEVKAFYFWDMGRLALKAQKWDLVLTLTQAWAKSEEGKQIFKQNSYLALSAAAKLAKGDAAGAQADMEELAKRKTTTWAEHRELLEAAVKKGDRGFRYDPGDQPPMYQVFKLPE